MAIAGSEFKKALNGQRWSASQAQAVVDAWQRSGESISGFCRSYDLDPARLGRWARRFSEDSTPQEMTLLPVRVVGATSELRAPSGAPAPLVLTCGGEYRIEVPEEFDSATLLDLLETLEERSSSW